MRSFPSHHPIWSIVKLVVIFIGVNSLLYMNASHFDGGEITTAVGTVALSAVLEGLGIRSRNPPA